MASDLKMKVLPIGVAGIAAYVIGRKQGEHAHDEMQAQRVIDLREAALAPDAQPGSTPGAGDADPQEAEAEHGRGRHARSPLQIPAAGWKDVLRRTLKEVKADNVSIISAGVAFYLMLALVPALIALVSLYGLLVSPAEVARQVEDLSRNLPASAGDLIREQLTSITSSGRSGLGVGLAVSLAGAIWSASSGMVALMRGLGVAYDQPDERKFVKMRGTALGLTVGLLLLLGALGGLLIGVPAALDAIGAGVVGTVLAFVARWLTLGAVLVLSLGLVYRYGPDRDRARWGWVSWGAIAAGVLWIAGTAAFAVYANGFASYNKTYGALAGVVVLLLWLYLTSMSILVGAELNAELERQTIEDTTVGRPTTLGRRKAVAADTLGEAAPSKA